MDGANNPLWRPSVIDIRPISDQPLGVGSAFKQGLKGPGGRRIDGDYEIVACRPNELIRFQVTAGPARPTGTYLFEPGTDATTVMFVLDYQPKGLARLMDFLIAKTMQGEIATLGNLKTHLEAQR